MSLRRVLAVFLLLAVLAVQSAPAVRLEPDPWAARLAAAETPFDPARFAYDDAVVERRLVTARDGITTLALDVIRPRTREKVPTIFLQSPYYNTSCRGWLHECKEPWGPIPSLSAQGGTTPFPEWYDEYFVPRGYAVVLQDQRGTRNSSGCQVYGGREEITDAVDVISWIAAQRWSNGAVGMTGGSYDGTIATGAASMAPPALKAIIPIRAIDRWYDYHFFNGVQSGDHTGTPASFTVQRPLQDVQNGPEEDLLFGPHVVERKACAGSIGLAVAAQYTLPYQDARSDFWSSRDFLKDAEHIRAATFIIHGLHDWNVKPTNAGHLWAALPARTPKKLWWFRGAHDDPARPEASESLPFPFPERFVAATHRWYARYLKGIDVATGPRVSIQGERGRWYDASGWPPPPRTHAFAVTPAGLIDARVAPRTGPSPGLGAFRSLPLRDPLRLAGQGRMRVRISLPAGGDASIVAILSAVREGAEPVEIARGYARAAYRDDIRARGPSWPTLPVPLAPGEVATLAFPFWPHDQVVPAGSRLELLLATSGGGGIGFTTGPVTVHDAMLLLDTAPPRIRAHRRADG